MSVCSDAFQLDPQLNQIGEILFDLRVVLSVRKADQLSVAVHTILITDHAKAFEIGSIQTQVHLFTLPDFNQRRLFKIPVESPLQRVFGQPALPTKCLKSLPFKDPFFKPDKPVPMGLIFGTPSEEDPTILTPKPLLAALFSPADYLQTSAGPAPLFFVFP